MKNEELEVNNKLPNGWIEIPFKDAKENISTTNKKLLQKEQASLFRSLTTIRAISPGAAYASGFHRLP